MASNFFDPVISGVCTNLCRTDDDCIPGWTCEDQDGGPTCTCSYAPEVCDGKDNDCDGIIDDGAGPQEECLARGSGMICLAGFCQCDVSNCDGCVDVSVDAKNCGVCGNACPSGQSCAGGSCVELETLVSGQPGPMFFGVDAVNVYWSQGQQAIDGPPTTAIPAGFEGGLPVPLALVSDGTTVFGSWTWGGESSGDISAWAVDGDGGTTLVDGESPSFGLAADAVNVYFTDGFVPEPFDSYYWQQNGDVVSVPKDDPMHPQILARGQAEPWGLALDEENVYWANFGDGTISSLPKSGGSPWVRADVQAGPTAVAVDAQNLYWTNAGTLAEVGLGISGTPPTIQPGTGSIVKLALTGGAPVTLVSGENYPAWGIVVDSTWVYWIDSAGPYDRTLTGALVKVPIAGGTPITLATNQVHPWNLALSGDALYWSVGDNPWIGAGGFLDGAILRMSIP